MNIKPFLAFFLQKSFKKYLGNVLKEMGLEADLEKVPVSIVYPEQVTSPYPLRLSKELGVSLEELSHHLIARCKRASQKHFLKEPKVTGKGYLSFKINWEDALVSEIREKWGDKLSLLQYKTRPVEIINLSSPNDSLVFMRAKYVEEILKKTLKFKAKEGNSKGKLRYVIFSEKDLSKFNSLKEKLKENEIKGLLVQRTALFLNEDKPVFSYSEALRKVNEAVSKELKRRKNLDKLVKRTISVETLSINALKAFLLSKNPKKSLAGLIDEVSDVDLGHASLQLFYLRLKNLSFAVEPIKPLEKLNKIRFKPECDLAKHTVCLKEVLRLSVERGRPDYVVNFLRSFLSKLYDIYNSFPFYVILNDEDRERLSFFRFTLSLADELTRLVFEPGNERSIKM